MKSRHFGPIAVFALACVGSLALARAPGEDLAKKLAELREVRDSAMSEWEQALRAATSQAEGQKIWQARPGRDLIPGFKALAIEAKGTDTAREAWLDVLEIAGEVNASEDARLAVDTTIADHITSPELGHFAVVLGESARVVGKDEAIKALDTLVAKSTYPAVQAPALFYLGNILIESKSAEQKVAGRKALDRLLAEFATVKPKRGAPYAEQAKGILFELDHLQIGMVAPNFDSIDENGQKFAVADYRGKVVVLDFWGNW